MKKMLLAMAGLLVLVQGAWADPVGGGVCRQSVVGGYVEQDFDVVLYGGEQTLITVHGDMDSDLDLYVYDENGYLIASDTDFTDQCVVAVAPIWTGHFTIRVVNRGPVSNLFTICAI